jgi:hypothetical protein
MMRATRPLILVHLFANALLLWLAYAWLGVDESTTGRLVWSAVDAIAILGLACWLYGATLVWFHGKHARLNEAFRAALPHVGALFVLAVVAIALYSLVSRAATASDQPALRLASWMTLKLRKPVKPAAIGGIFHGGFWVLRWVVLPALIVPVASGFATGGWRGWRGMAAVRSWKVWAAIPLLALAGLGLPGLILGWRPHFAAFGLEMASFVVRAVVAYVLFVAAMLGLAKSRFSDRVF